MEYYILLYRIYNTNHPPRAAGNKIEEPEKAARSGPAFRFAVAASRLPLRACARFHGQNGLRGAALFWRRILLAESRFINSGNPQKSSKFLQIRILTPR